jgi:hypothetical protein
MSISARTLRAYGPKTSIVHTRSGSNLASVSAPGYTIETLSALLSAGWNVIYPGIAATAQ